MKDQKKIEYSSELESFSAQFVALAIYCEMCMSEKNKSTANDRRANVIETCLSISQQAMMTVNEADEMKIITGNVGLFLSLCKDCKNREGLIVKEFARRDLEVAKAQETEERVSSLKVVPHPGRGKG